jgi:hypothetical protein
VVESDPTRLLETIRETTGVGDVHPVGGPRTIETYVLSARSTSST